MLETVKICSKHGDLKTNEVGSNNRCLFCMREKGKIYSDKNREKVRDSSRKHREKVKKQIKENGLYIPRKNIPNNELQMQKTCKKHGELDKKYIMIREGKYLRCKLCVFERNNRWRKNHPNKVKEIKRNTYLRHIGKYSREAILRKYKNITREEYEKLLEYHNNKCGICNREETRIARKDGTASPLSIDHDHKTGKIRGLLCNQCNRALGFFEDSISSLTNAIDYLKRTSSDFDN